MSGIVRTTAVAVATALTLAAAVTTAEGRNFDRGGFGGKHSGGTATSDATDIGGLFRLGLDEPGRGDPDRCNPYGVYGDCG